MKAANEQQSPITWHPTAPSPAQLAAWTWLWTRLLGSVASKNDNTPAAGPPGYRLDASTVTSSAAQLESLISDNTTP